jgi:hypothetical protein
MVSITEVMFHTLFNYTGINSFLPYGKKLVILDLF